MSQPISPAAPPGGIVPPIKLPRINLYEIYVRFKNFGLWVLYLMLVVFIFGIICTNILSFIRPSDKNFTNEIFDNDLDKLFPDDISGAPYGFVWNRGMARFIKSDKPANAEKTEEEVAADEEKKEADSKKYSWAWLVNFLQFETDTKLAEPAFPYDLLKVEMVPVVDSDEKQGFKLPNDADDTEDRLPIKDNMGTEFKNMIKENIGNSLYFSYGNGRYYMKRLFKRFNMFMRNKTPTSGAPEIKGPDPEYAYMSNAMCLIIPIVLAFLSLVMMGWGPITTIIGSIANITYKKAKAADTEHFASWKLSKLANGLITFLFVGAFAIMPIAISSFTIQPIMLALILFIYPLARSFTNFKQIFLEIVPMLMLIFVACSVGAGFYHLDQPVAIFIGVFMAIVYFKIFGDKINNMRAYITQILMEILKFKDHEKIDKAEAAVKKAAAAAAPPAAAAVKPVVAAKPS
jgi:hypothetical protein